METKTYNIYYDKESDFLEVFFGEPTESYTEEVEPGVFVRRDDKTDDVTSIGILSFKKRTSLLNNFLKKINLSMPINVVLNSD